VRVAERSKSAKKAAQPTNAVRREGGKMATCETCECAIHALAPKCEHCGTRIVGHGLEKDGTYYCCDHCAKKEGVTDLRDRL
jgi:hypothetical protein